MLSTIFVLGLIMSAIAFIIGPLLRSQDQTQAKVDTVQAAAMALYRVQRDLRNTDVGSIYACTTGASPACATPGPTLSSTSAIVMSSAYLSGTGPFQLDAVAKPDWQGATVYWVDAVGNLNVAFDQPSTYTTDRLLNSVDAQNAVIDVTARGGMQLARFVERLSLSAPAPGRKVTFQMQAQSTVNGALNETTYQTDIETRN